MRSSSQAAVLFALGIAAGVSLVVQVVMNTRLRVGLASWSWAGFVSYLGGTVSMAVLLLVLREPLPSEVARAGIPWWGWIGGLFGAIYIVLAIILVPRFGAAMTVTLVVAGQMLGALAFDAFGVMGIARQLPSPGRLLGALLLVAAVALMRT